MEQIFDWMREQITKHKAKEINLLEDRVWNHAIRMCMEFVDEAEAKWEAEVCEWKFEKNTGLVWHCENECESYNISYQRELKTFLEEFECKCPHCGKHIKISEVE